MKKGLLLIAGILLLISCSSAQVVSKKEADRLDEQAHPLARRFLM